MAKKNQLFSALAKNWRLHIRYGAKNLERFQIGEVPMVPILYLALHSTAAHSNPRHPDPI